jgi:hypothetical protein
LSIGDEGHYLLVRQRSPDRVAALDREVSRLGGASPGDLAVNGRKVEKSGKKNPHHELIVWAPLKAGGFNDLANFGTLIFK